MYTCTYAIRSGAAPLAARIRVRARVRVRARARVRVRVRVRVSRASPSRQQVAQRALDDAAPAALVAASAAGERVRLARTGLAVAHDAARRAVRHRLHHGLRHLGVHGGLVLGGRQHAVDLKLHGVRRGAAAGAAAVALGAEPDQPPRGVGPDHRLAITLAGRPQPHEDADALVVASLGRRLARRARAGRWGRLRR